MRAGIVLTPAESKRLIAKAIVQKSEIKKAMETAYVILCEGSINVMIAQELFGLDIACKDFICGMVTGGVVCSSNLCSSRPKMKVSFLDSSKPEIWATLPLVAYKGKIVDFSYKKALEDFHLDTVIIKGGNAIDQHGNVGVIVAGYDGGVIAQVLGHSVSQGVKIICPIGLEKSVFSVRDAAQHTGGKRFDYSMGADYGLFVVSSADVVTEIEAIKILSGADAFHVASGGIGGSEGAVVLSCEGSSNEVNKIIKIVENIKGEPPQWGIRQKCNQCKYIKCIFHGKEEESLPKWTL